MKTRIAFVGFGEVASVFGGALAAAGAELAAYDILLEQPGGAERLAARAGGTLVRFCPLAQAVGGSAYVLSTVTTPVAREVARACARHLRPGQVYIDMNATEPAVKVEIEAIIAPTGAAFVEGAVLGAVGVTGAKTEVLLGGARGRRAERDLGGTLGLNVRFYSEEIGKASMFKMLRSVFSKGLEALLVEFLAAGERAGIRADLWREVAELMARHPFEQTASNWVRSHATAHVRRHHEMRQAAGVLRQLGIEPVMTAATEAFFARSGTLGLSEAFATTPSSLDEVVGFVAARLAAARPARSWAPEDAGKGVGSRTVK
jgi:3-hydroxyisobutyrate dehydrogenase-like beta-hydroxyacid dehydrogenase